MSSRKRAKSLEGTDADVGARVRALRMQRGLSQNALAKALGITFQQVQKYERGANGISCSRLHQIACILDVKPQHFFEAELKRTDAQQTELDMQEVDQFLSSKDGIDLVRAFGRIKDDDLKHVITKIVADLCEISLPGSLLL